MQQPAPNTNWNVKLQKKLPLVLAGKLLPSIFLLVITILYSRQLAYNDYGKFQTVWVLTSLAGTILSFGLPAIILATPSPMLMRHLKEHRSGITIGYGALLIIALGFIWLGTPGFSLYLRAMAALFILLQTACIIAETRLIKHNSLRQYVVINGIYSVIFFSAHIYFLYNSFSLERLVTTTSILSAVKLVCLLLVKNDHKQPEDNFIRISFIKNWMYTGINEVTGIVTRYLDKIFLLFLLTPADFAIFYNGAFEIPLFAVVISAIENVMLANISEDVSNKAEAKNIFRESFKMLSLITFPVFFFFLFCHAETYGFLFGGKYDASIPVFLVSIFILPLRITHYGVILQCYGRAGKLLAGSVADIIISLGLMFVLYPLLGPRGVVLALVVSTYLQVLYYLFQSAKAISVKVTDLVPLAYLAKLFAGLGVFYFLMSLSRNYFAPALYLAGMFILSTIIVLAGLYRYFFVHSKNIRLVGKNP